MRLLPTFGVLFGCHGPDDPSDPGAPAVVGTPRLEMSADPDVPFVGVLHLETDVPTSLRIEAVTGDERWDAGADGVTAVHEATVLGWLPGAAHEVRATATDAEGRSVEVVLEATAPPLPDDLPPLTVLASEPDRMEPGYTLMPLWPPGNRDDSPWWAVVVDAEGRVRWVYRSPDTLVSLRAMPGGTLRYVRNPFLMAEIDLRGRTLRSWAGTAAADPPADALLIEPYATHHDALSLPDGNLVTLSGETRRLPDYPASVYFPDGATTETDVFGDVLAEFDPDTGEVVREIRLLDALDPTRIAYDGVSTGVSFWDPVVGRPVSDWSHGNAVSYREETDTLMVSLRHQDAVVGFDWSDGTLQWIVAPDVDWRADLAPYVLGPAGRDEGPAYHQHGAELTADGHLIVFDNGNNRASAGHEPLPDDEISSRAMEWTIDPVAGTRTVHWSWSLPDGPDFSEALGDADVLPLTGNALLTWGDVPDGPWGEVLEVDREGDGDVLFRVRLEGGRIFAAERIPSWIGSEW